MTGGVLASLVTRNAMVVAMLSAVALPVGIAVALFSGEAVLSTGIWLWLAFVIGAAGSIAILAVLSLYGPRWVRDLTGDIFRGTSDGKHGL